MASASNLYGNASDRGGLAASRALPSPHQPTLLGFVHPSPVPVPPSPSLLLSLDSLGPQTAAAPGKKRPCRTTVGPCQEVADCLWGGNCLISPFPPSQVELSLLPQQQKMNWVGGSRNRIILKQEKRKQKEFFEKKKLKSKMKLLGVSSPKSSAVSLDLLNLYVVNQISSKQENTQMVRKPVHIDITEDARIPVRRHNMELPMSPIRTQHLSNLDDIQNRLQKQVLDSRRQHIAEKAKYQYNLGNSSDQDPWIKKLPRQWIFRRSDTVPQELFKPLHRLDYINSARKDPLIMTSNESENSEGTREPLFDVVKETAELKAPQDGSDSSFLALFEAESQPIHTNPSTKHFNHFGNESRTDIFFSDPDARNQTTNRNYLYGTAAAYPAINTKQSSVDRHLEGIFTVPEQILLQSNNVSCASYRKNSDFHKTHLQDCLEGQHYFVPSEDKEKPANLENAETFAYHHDNWNTVKENVQKYSRKKSDNASVKETAWRQNQFFGFEEFTTAQEKESKFGMSLDLRKMEKDVESPLNSQSPSYSPRQTESCFSSSPDRSEIEDTAKKKEYLNEQSLKIDDANLILASASTELPKNSYTETMPLQLSSILTRDAANHLQEKVSVLCPTEEENNNHSAPSESSSLHQELEIQHVTPSSRCDVWLQTESSVTEVRKVDVATQCDTMQVCSCGISLRPACSPEGIPGPSTAGTTGGHKMPAHEVPQPVCTSSAAGIATLSSEAEYLSLAGRRTLEVLNYIDIMKERKKQ